MSCTAVLLVAHSGIRRISIMNVLTASTSSNCPGLPLNQLKKMSGERTFDMFKKFLPMLLEYLVTEGLGWRWSNVNNIDF